jgi:RNA-directed DNA polymerase
MQQKIDKIQSDIVSALKENNNKRADRLATILVRSKAAHIISLHKLLSNKGIRSPGWSVPNKRPTTNSEYSIFIERLREVTIRPTSYKSTPLYRIYIPKKVPGKFRPISIPSYFDRLIQAVYLLALDP